MTLLELTAHILPGQNSIRFIHLGDLSSYTFLLHADEQRQSSMPHDTLNPKQASTKDLVDFDWDNYTTRLQTNHSDIGGGVFKFASTVEVSRTV
jgi:hypothetical protein